MWWRAYFGAVLGVTALALLTGLLLGLHSEPSTSVIDQDIAKIQSEIEDATTERDKQSGGLVVGLIEVRSNLLKTTQSMLQAKRLSWLRRVNMTFTVEGRPAEPQSQQSLDAIKKDFQDSEESPGLRPKPTGILEDSFRGWLWSTLLLNASRKRNFCSPIIRPNTGSSLLFRKLPVPTRHLRFLRPTS
jgi:hypothetical protein